MSCTKKAQNSFHTKAQREEEEKGKKFKRYATAMQMISITGCGEQRVNLGIK